MLTSSVSYQQSSWSSHKARESASHTFDVFKCFPALHWVGGYILLSPLEFMLPTQTTTGCTMEDKVRSRTKSHVHVQKTPWGIQLVKESLQMMYVVDTSSPDPGLIPPKLYPAYACAYLFTLWVTGENLREIPHVISRNIECIKWRK